MPSSNRQIRLKRRPVGMPAAEDFEMVEVALADVPDGQVLRRTIYLSLDPYMRGRMSDAPSYAKPVGIGDAMELAKLVDSYVRTKQGLLKHDETESRLLDAQERRAIVKAIDSDYDDL